MTARMLKRGWFRSYLTVAFAMAASASGQTPAEVLWTEAAKSAAADGVRVRMGSSISPSADGTCETPEDLLMAEAETIFRQGGFTPVRTVNPDVWVTFYTAVVPGGISRCAVSWTLSVELYGSHRVNGTPFLGFIPVENYSGILVHHSSDHRGVLREKMNEQATIVANELARHRPAQ